MDGRRLSRWLLSGCLVAGAMGCNRNSVQSPMSPAGQSVPGVATISPSKPFWGNSTPTPAAPVETTIEMTKKNAPPKPETLVALADVQLAAAFEEKTAPSSREGLLDMARQGYQKALQIDPKNKQALLALANFYTKIGDKERALETYKKYMTLNPKDAEVAHKVAMASASWKDWVGAVGWCDKALQLDPENMTYRKTKAFCLARGGLWEESFKILCQIMPEAQARYDIACVMAHQNQMDACRRQLELSMKADPSYAPAQEFLAGLDQPPGPPAADPNNTIQRAGYTQQP